MLRDELQRDWRGVRYLVPTVGHKRSIEHLLLAQPDVRQGLLGDPLTTFFNFAEEVAQRAQVQGHKLSELQKYLLLKRKVREARLSYFDRARRYPGFVQALGEAIDELKVHMVWSDELLKAAQVARERQLGDIGEKLSELGGLYKSYQEHIIQAQLYDNEGIMWIAAECLQRNPDLFADLHCLILDGFARLTPIQGEFLRRLAPRIARTIVLFDFEEGRTDSYHPVLDSLHLLRASAGADPLELREHVFERYTPLRKALPFLRDEIFCERKWTHGCDDSLGLSIGATPAQEAELIAREVRALLREGRLPDGTPVTSADIAILARNADAIYERLVHTFARYDLSIRREPSLLAHTSVGRAMLAVLRLVRDGWRREDLLVLLKSGLLAITPATAFRIDLIARQHSLRDGKSAWTERWPDDATRGELQQALQPLLEFDRAYHQRETNAETLMAAAEALLQAFRVNALPPPAPLPEIDARGAARFIELDAVFTHATRVLGDLRNLGALLGGYRREETIEVITTALLRETLPEPAQTREGIPILAVHTTGGEKFKVVFLCNLLQGVFPRHLRESAFLLDHERDESLPELNVRIEGRRHLEADEQYWFLHALSTATHRLVLSYAAHDFDGTPIERSSFLDEVDRLVPQLRETARKADFRDVVPPLVAAESADEFTAALVYGLRTERREEGRAALTAAYAAYPAAPGPLNPLARLFRPAVDDEATLRTTEILTRLQQRRHPYSASELQGYVDCPLLWFGAFCLRVGTIEEEFGPLDRGQILHGVLEKFYRDHQKRPGQPVHLEDYLLDELWPEVEADLQERLTQEPRFLNRPQFLRDLEAESLRRMMRRFLRNEILRAASRRTHPAFFEQRFGSGHGGALWAGEKAVSLQGVIDRIDLLDDDPTQAVVVDYKSSSAMSLRELAEGKVLQAPIYALATLRVLGLTPLGVEFMGLKQAEARGIYRQEAEGYYDSTKGMRLLAEEEWLRLLRHSELQIVQAAEDIAAGRIMRDPTTRRCPHHCDYFPFCRGERYQLERIVRRKQESAESVEA